MGDTSNLIKWQPGQSGNPSGGPRKPKSITKAALKKVMMETLTAADMRGIVRKAIAQAKQGNRYARRDILEYTLGKPVAMEATDNDAVLTLIQVLSGRMPEEDDVIEAEAVEFTDDDEEISDEEADEEEEEDITPE